MRTPFAFIDETGLLNSNKDPYFAIGLIKSQRAATLYPKFRSLRTKFNHYPELKFNKLTKKSLEVAKAFVDVLFDSPVSSFNCIIIPKHDKEFDPEKYFDNDIFEIYRKFMVVLLKFVIGPIDILTVLADDYFSPYNQNSLETFEGGIRAIVNDHMQRLAITGICQIKSNNNDFIQLADIILGSVILDLKIQEGKIDIEQLSSTKKIQIELLNHIKARVNLKEDHFLLKKGVSVKTFKNKKPSLRINLFDPKKAVNIIKKSGPSSM